MFDRSLMQRKADVRGIYPNQINEELAWLSRQCIATYVAKTTAEKSPASSSDATGGSRLSLFYSALVQGIAAAGATPLPCGLATTDMVQWGVGEQLDGAIAGVMITASHNPAEYNGIKSVLLNQGHRRPRHDQPSCPFGLDFRRRGRFWSCSCPGLCPICERSEPETSGAIHRGRLPALQEPAEGDRQGDPRPRQRCRRTVCSAAQAGPGRTRATAEVHAVAERIDGTFPTRPSNPGLPGAVKLLQRTVVEQGAKFGAAFDGDADRVFLVDEWGQFVSGSLLLAASVRTRSRRPWPLGRSCLRSSTRRCRRGWSWNRPQGWRSPVVSRVGQDALKGSP